MKTPDVMVAKLSGAVRADVAVVKHRGSHYFVAPERLGGLRRVPADSLTDCLHYCVWEMGEDMKAKGKPK